MAPGLMFFPVIKYRTRNNEFKILKFSGHILNYYSLIDIQYSDFVKEC
jgi:hypothetical protein